MTRFVRTRFVGAMSEKMVRVTRFVEFGFLYVFFASSPFSFIKGNGLMTRFVGLGS